MIFGQGEFKYELVEGWGKLPGGWKAPGDINGVAVDSQDRVYTFSRSEHPVMVFDRDGRFLTSWGEGTFVRPHGITITRDELVYLTDDSQHVVRKYTLDGKLLMTLGTLNQPSDTGYDKNDPYPSATIKRGAGPFNRPTKVGEAENGDIYVTDGYGNARVHRFTAAGELIQSWGEPGEGPGQFNLPHCVWIHTDGSLYVCDRENSRVQHFSPTGEYLDRWDLEGRPQEMYIDKNNIVYMSVMNSVGGGRTMAGKPMAETIPGHISIRDMEGSLLAQWGGTNPGQLDSFMGAHGVTLDSHGDIYVVENGETGMKRLGLKLPSYPCLRKFARV